MKNYESTTVPIPDPELSIETDELLEAMHRAETVTVEFGTGATPLFEAGGTMQFDANNLYVGVNVEPNQHALLADRVGDVDGFALLADFSDKTVHLPIPSETVDRVFLGNVLGEPESEMIMEDFKEPDGIYYGSSSFESKIESLREAVRMLKENGELVILENNTPYIKRFDRQEGEQSYTGTVEILQALGLEATAVVSKYSDAWDETVGKYATPEEWWSDWSYLVIAEKPDHVGVAV